MSAGGKVEHPVIEPRVIFTRQIGSREAEVSVDNDSTFMIRLLENGSVSDCLVTGNLIYGLGKANEYLFENFTADKVTELEREIKPIDDLRYDVETVSDGAYRLKFLVKEKVLFSKLFPSKLKADMEARRHLWALEGWKLAEEKVRSPGRPSTFWIGRGNRTHKAHIVYISPGQWGGMFGLALRVYKRPNQLIYARFKLFPQAVELGNSFVPSDQRTASPPASEENRGEYYGAPLTLQIEESNTGVASGESGRAVYEFKKGNIKTTITPTTNILPPGYWVNIYVDGRHITSICKDTNHGGFTYTLSQAIGKARELLESLQGWSTRPP
ncbi:hypothetical protein [Candidatus Pyrohabitans sp.]